jgi:hypothetical protein
VVQPADHGASDLIMLVVPTRVGVNRPKRAPSTAWTSRPHTRGGEPDIPPGCGTNGAVVPTRVGVNRLDHPPARQIRVESIKKRGVLELVGERFEQVDVAKLGSAVGQVGVDVPP